MHMKFSNRRIKKKSYNIIKFQKVTRKLVYRNCEGKFNSINWLKPKDTFAAVNPHTLTNTKRSLDLLGEIVKMGS